MKHLYSIFSVILIFISVSLQSQDRVYAPSLTFPEDAEVGLAPDVTLDWNAVTGETLEVTYELQLSETVDFTNAITFPITNITSHKMEDLLFGSLYFWRVRAYDGPEISDWSTIWSFAVAVSIEMLDPSDASMVYADPNISWEELTGLLKYQIQIDTSYIWNAVPTGITEDIFSSFIINENDMWLIGDNGLVLHYEGADWMQVDVGATEALNDIYFVDASTGFIVGDGGTFLMYDGTAWTSISTDVTDNLSGVAFFDATNGYLVGDDGVILKYTDGTFTTEVATDESASEITDDLYDIAVLSVDNYWVCGKGKVIVNYNGTEWTGGEVGGKDHYSIWFNNANDGWVGSKDGRIQHFDGSEWTEIRTDADDLFGISFDGATGYAAGKSGEMVIYNGIEWSKITSGTSETLNTLYLKDGFGISAGDNGTLINKAGEGFNSPWAKIISVIPDSTNYDMANLLFDKSFYYRMRGIHSQDTSSWSGAKSMTTYPYPDLTGPSDGSSDEDLEILFQWEEYSGVVRYYIETSLFEDFSTSLNFITDSNSILLRGFNYGDEYFWRVRAEHSDDVSPWSESRSFTTLNTITLLAPEDGEVGVSKCPRYSWEEVLGSSAYQVYVDTDENFTNPLTGISETDFLQCESGLELNTSYFWKVRGIAGVDTSDWSATWLFEIEGPEAIDDLFTDKSLEVYPNPTTGTFTISLFSVDNATYDITINDLSGRTIYKTEYVCQQGSNQMKLNLSEELANGAYMINVSRDNQTVNKRLLIK